MVPSADHPNPIARALPMCHGRRMSAWTLLRTFRSGLRLLTLLMALGVSAAPAFAQPETNVERVVDETPPSNSDIRTDPETGERYRDGAPSEPLRQGPLTVPGWALVLIGVFVATASVAAMIRFAFVRRGR